MGNMADFKVKRLGLICGGTGIAVMYPVNFFFITGVLIKIAYQSNT